MNLTQKAAELMLSTGEWYTAGDLGHQLGISAQQASGLIYNIRNSGKYKVEQTAVPGRKVKVVSVAGRSQSLNALWRSAIFGRQPSGNPVFDEKGDY